MFFDPEGKPVVDQSRSIQLIAAAAAGYIKKKKEKKKDLNKKEDCPMWRFS